MNLNDYLGLLVTRGPLGGGGNYGTGGATMASLLPGGGLFDYQQGGNNGQDSWQKFIKTPGNDPVLKTWKQWDPVNGAIADTLDPLSGILGGLFGGGKPKPPYWQQLARKETAQGNAVLSAYNALYEPTLALARQSAQDYGDLWRRQANEGLAFQVLSNQTNRRADIADYMNLGPDLLQARRSADPLFGQAYDQASQDLTDANAPLPANVRRDVSQGVLQSLNERGMSLGGAGAFDEALQLALQGEQFRSQRRNQAFGEANTLLGIYGDPFQSITGRVARPQPNGANIQSPDYPAFNNDLFSYGVNSELQQNNLNAAKQAGNKALIGNIVGGVLGAAGGIAMCWVAREVFGPTSPKWKQFRNYLMAAASPDFRQWYVKHGEAFAESIKNRPDLKAKIRTWMKGQIRELRSIQTQPA